MAVETGGVVGGLGTVEAMVAAFRDASVMAVATEGPEHRFVAANEVMRQVANGRELLGLPLAEVLPDASGQGFDNLFGRVFETGESISNYNWRVQLDRPGGGFTEFYASFSLAPWRDEDGSIRGVVGHAMDVTAEVQGRQQAEAAAARAERRYRDEHELVLELQDSLLPHALPVVPGLQSAGRYLVAEENTAAGGDWFEAIVLPDGHVALVVGDVVGHGVAASALMGQLRAVLGERLAAGAGVSEALEALDRVAERTVEARAATVAVADLDPVTGELTYCTAGHPAPLVLAGEGGRYLPPTGAGPLASGLGFPVATAVLEEGDLLLLYSDGIIERPGLSAGQGMRELARAARRNVDGKAFRDQSLPVDRVCAHTIEMLVRETGYTDDITLLAAQRVPQPGTIDLVAQVRPELPGEVRTLVSRWLEPFGASANDAFALELAVVECVTNVLDHAYGDEPGMDRPVEITARLEESGHAVIRIADHGRWRTIAGPGAEDRGRGLMMVTQLIDHVTVDRLTVDRVIADVRPSVASALSPGAASEPAEDQQTGTLVTLRHALTRPVALISQDAPSPGRVPRVNEDSFHSELDGPVLRVQGPVDALAVDALRADLFQLVSGRHPHATVDLSGVTILASAGVQVLLEVLDRVQKNDQVELTLQTPAGSAAHQVLELTRLPSRQ
jgi:serine phosphatase RsbU (regulator of sigma subunit)/anti-sigma regulatory factor (Ser/Thr protein kinase)/anti-anti-sigma regulatory factor